MTTETSLDPVSRPILGASPAVAMRRFAGNAFRLRGRASRSEYWWWMLVNTVVLVVFQFLVPWLISGRTPQPTLSIGPFGSVLYAELSLFSTTATDAPSSPLAAFALLIAGIWLIATVIPGVTVAVRRLHDSNMAGWWALLAVVPLGPLVVLLLALRRPRAEGARFDRCESPRAPAEPGASEP